MTQPEIEEKTLLDRTFEVSIVLKGLDGVLELVGGALLLVMSPATITHIADSLLHIGWLAGSHGLIAHYIEELRDYVLSGTLFAAFYLLAHGVVKVVLVVAVLRRQLWAYPVMILFLVFFILYQVYLMALHFGVPLLLLTIFDVFVVWLTWEEYGKLKLRITAERRTSA